MESNTPLEVAVLVGLLFLEILTAIALLILGYHWLTGVLAARRYRKQCEERERMADAARANWIKTLAEAEEKRLIASLRKQDHDRKATLSSSPRPGA